MNNTRTITITQRERLAAKAFRRGDQINEIAAILGLTSVETEAWLDSDRVQEACQAVTRSDTHRSKRKKKT